MKIVLLGSGKAATGLGLALLGNGNTILQVYSRNLKHAKLLAKDLGCGFTHKTDEIIQDADLYLLAIKDDAVPDFLKTLKIKKGILAHVSGILGSDVFPARFKETGVFYPMKSFSDKTKTDLKDALILVEGSSKKVVDQLLILGKSLSPQVLHARNGMRMSVHLAAVFSNNFPNYLNSIAEQILKKEGLSLSVFLPMLKSWVNNLEHNSPRKLQTGPAKRGDLKTLKAHEMMLSNNPEIKKIYRLLSQSILKAERDS